MLRKLKKRYLESELHFAPLPSFLQKRSGSSFLFDFLFEFGPDASSKAFQVIGIW